MNRIVLAELAGSASYGGGERYLELLCKHLDATRFRTVLICPESGSFVGRMQAQGVETRVIELAPLFNPFALMRLVRLLRREGVTILQTHGARANFYGRVAGWLAGVPIVVSTVHNSIGDYEVSRLKRWIYTSALRVTLPWAHRIICVSEAIRRDVLRNNPAAASLVETVYNGIDRRQLVSTRDRAAMRRALAVGDGPLVVVVARLTPPKGHRYLIDAIALLRQRWPTLYCVCVGEGELQESLQAYAVVKGMVDRCWFVGATNCVADWYEAADVVVLPSLSEGFPFVVLEALAMAKPLVATKVNGVPEAIEHGQTGLLVDPRDAEGLARAIEVVLEQPELAEKMGRAGSAIVQERFTVDRMIDRTVAVFESALRERVATTSAERLNVA
ncbi:MAG: glycosyltransferase [Nitrospira sp.]